jgi:HSP20 family molecular chaperone IbpA
MTTTRTLVFDSPLLLGFEHTRALLERASKGADGYPPYNVEQLDGGGVRITLAVAGFSADQLLVEVQANQLLVAGRRDGEDAKADGAYLHRGIAARGFQRAFVLADGMEVAEAVLEHGLLHVTVLRPEPQRLVKRIPIRTAG